MISKEKIAFIDYDLSVIGGVERVTCSMANALSNDFDVTIISLCKKNEQIPYELLSQIQVSYVLEGDAHIRDLITKGRQKLRQVIKELDVSVVICMGTYPGAIAAFDLLGMHTKKIFFDHGALMTQWDDKITRYMRKFATKHSNYTVVLSEQSRKSYMDKFHIKPDKIECIYNYIDDLVKESAQPYNPTNCSLLTMGRISSEKGMDLLIEVAKQVLPQSPNWHWDVYGDGPSLEEYKMETTKLGLDHLRFMGQTKKAYELYGNYSIYVMTSYREGLPLVLLEAKENGLPIVSFDILTGPSEVVLDNEEGYLIEPYNIDKMSKQLLSLMNDQKMRESFSEHTLTTKDKFAKDSILTRWKELLHEV